MSSEKFELQYEQPVVSRMMVKLKPGMVLDIIDPSGNLAATAMCDRTKFSVTVNPHGISDNDNTVSKK